MTHIHINAHIHINKKLLKNYHMHQAYVGFSCHRPLNSVVKQRARTQHAVVLGGKSNLERTYRMWSRALRANTIPFYLKDLSICRFGCPGQQVVLELFPGRSQRIAVSLGNTILWHGSSLTALERGSLAQSVQHFPSMERVEITDPKEDTKMNLILSFWHSK